MHTFLEIENGKYYVRVSPYSASNPSTMHERGKPFPDSLKPEYDSLELAAIGLQELTNYYQCLVEKKVSKKRGQG